jgi:hypothetical protein
VIIAAFAGSLLVGLVSSCCGPGGLRTSRAGAIGGPFQLTDQAGRPSPEEFEGQADADLLRLHPLPRCLPTSLFEISEC